MDFLNIWDKMYIVPYFYHNNFIFTSIFILWSLLHRSIPLAGIDRFEKIGLIYYFFITFSLHESLAKLLLTCCWHIQFPGIKENRTKNYARKKSQAANKPKTFSNQQVSSPVRSHFVVSMLPFSRFHNWRLFLYTINKIFDTVAYSFLKHFIFSAFRMSRASSIFPTLLTIYSQSSLLDSVILWPPNMSRLSFHISSPSKLPFWVISSCPVTTINLYVMMLMFASPASTLLGNSDSCIHLSIWMSPRYIKTKV